MATVAIIGGSGHVGTYLVPRLVAEGHRVINVTRGARKPYQPHGAWTAVETVIADREAEDAAGTFGARIAALGADIVIDMICFTTESAAQLADALTGRVQHLLHCGTIWVYGHNAAVPATESDPLNAFGRYGEQKAAIETDYLDRARRGNLPVTVFRPGHIVGPGWAPLNPAGHFNPAVFTQIAHGEALTLPNFGLETVHHVHADDVAQIVMGAITHRSAAVGEAFNAVSAQAINLKGYALAMYRFFGQAPRLNFAPYDSWKVTVAAEDAAATWEHIARSPSHSIEKARALLGYAPRYSSLMAVEESVRALIAAGAVRVPAGSPLAP